MKDDLKCLLEELRVALPGVQILFAFLLIAPFNQRFELVKPLGLVLFVVALIASCAASICLIAPSVYHRLHIHRDVADQEQMLRVFNRLALTGAACLSVGIVGAVSFVAAFLFGGTGAIVAMTASASLCGGLWYVLPTVRRAHEQRILASSSVAQAVQSQRA